MRIEDPHHPPGSRAGADGTSFVVWAPYADRVELHVTSPFDKVVTMQPSERGYHRAFVEGAEAGARYLVRPQGGEERPDPASRSQPEGVHAPSEVTSSGFAWTDHGWDPPSLADYVIYEAHVGALTDEGTFDAAVGVLDDLAELGITALELMPVAEFPGSRNWGYDGVYPYAPQSTYGGPEGLKRLVDECHRRGLAVVLDVVYNHLGPEGCYLDEFGPYFTDRYHTPWGRAINFDGRGSDEVRRFFVGNALYWLEEFHIDALRLDAVHAIADNAPLPFLEELSSARDELCQRLGLPKLLIAETPENDARLLRPRTLGGTGIDAQWNDDFHHALASLIAGEAAGYYSDYGTPAHLTRAYRAGYVYQGEHSRFRQRRHGRPFGDLGPEQLVVYATNHDQTGNRPAGDRLSTRVSFEDLKLMAAAVLLSPYLPMVFMGEEYGETAPFAYFVSHGDPGLVESVRKGRREEFSGFEWTGEPTDPQDEQTFLSCKLDRSLAGHEPNATLVAFHKELMRIRREVRAVARSEERLAQADDGVVVAQSQAGGDRLALYLNTSSEASDSQMPRDGIWESLADSADQRWRGPGGSPERVVGGDTFSIAPRSAVLYRRMPA